jgi:hypothetical protein
MSEAPNKRPYREWQPELRNLLRQLGSTPLRTLAALLEIPYDRIAANINATAARGSIHLTKDDNGAIIVHLADWAVNEDVVLREMKRRRKLGQFKHAATLQREKTILIESRTEKAVRLLRMKLFIEADVYLTENENIVVGWPGGPAPRHARYLGRFGPLTPVDELHRTIAKAFTHAPTN